VSKVVPVSPRCSRARLLQCHTGELAVIFACMRRHLALAAWQLQNVLHADAIMAAAQRISASAARVQSNGEFGAILGAVTLRDVAVTYGSRPGSEHVRFAPVASCEAFGRVAAVASPSVAPPASKAPAVPPAGVVPAAQPAGAVSGGEASRAQSPSGDAPAVSSSAPRAPADARPVRRPSCFGIGSFPELHRVRKVVQVWHDANTRVHREQGQHASCWQAFCGDNRSVALTVTAACRGACLA
jgi:hypothetical protein